MRWNTSLGMPSALTAQASGSPLGIAHHSGRDPCRQYQRLAKFECEIFGVGGERRHLQRFDGARYAREREWAPKVFSGASDRLCRISARSPAAAAKNMALISAASCGCIDKADMRNCASVGGLSVGAAGGSTGMPRASGTRGLGGRNPSFLVMATGVFG